MNVFLDNNADWKGAKILKLAMKLPHPVLFVKITSIFTLDYYYDYYYYFTRIISFSTLFSV